jgi:hypothetical protein
MFYRTAYVHYIENKRKEGSLSLHQRKVRILCFMGKALVSRLTEMLCRVHDNLQCSYVLSRAVPCPRHEIPSKHVAVLAPMRSFLVCYDYVASFI